MNLNGISKILYLRNVGVKMKITVTAINQSNYIGKKLCL